VWGETLYAQETGDILGNFNPLSPCGERPEHFNKQLNGALISTHSPRVGRDNWNTGDRNTGN